MELRFPLVNLALTPIGLLGPVRGTFFFNFGGAHYKDQPYKFATNDDGISYVNDPVFGEKVSGFRLVDGRASFGFGLQVFLLGYPMHFDWSRLTDMQNGVRHEPVRLLDRVRFLMSWGCSPHLQTLGHFPQATWSPLARWLTLRWRA